VGPRAVLDAVVKRKFPSPRRESNPRTPIVQPVTTWILLRKETGSKEETRCRRDSHEWSMGADDEVWFRVLVHQSRARL
jgi:hypothetical protein